MSTIAAFAALAGSGAYAASQISSKDIGKNAVRAKHIKKQNVRAKHIKRNNVTSKHVKNGGLRAADFRDGDLPVGAAGPRGEPGPQGPVGPAGSPDSAEQVLDKLAGVDGSGSGLDADQLDGLGSESFATASLFGNGSPPSGQSTGTSNDGCLIGSILAHAGTRVPSGYISADGREVPVSTYDLLYSVIGYRFGIGGGGTSFAVPDLRGAEPRGRGPEGISYMICAKGAYPSTT